MKRAYASFLMLLVLIGCRSQSKKPDSLLQQKLNQTALLLDTNSIEAVRVMHAPPAEHPFRITLDALISDSSYSLRLSNKGLDAHAHELAEALRSAESVPSTWSGDVSWALVHYNRDGKETLRIGLDESGRNGYVGSDAVRLNSGIVKWARAVLPE